MRKGVVAVALAFAALLTASGGAWGAEGVPGESGEKGWYACSGVSAFGEGRECVGVDVSVEKQPVKATPRSTMQVIERSEKPAGSGEQEIIKFLKKAPKRNKPQSLKVRDASIVRRVDPGSHGTAIYANVPYEFFFFCNRWSIPLVAVNMETKECEIGELVRAGKHDMEGAVPALGTIDKSIVDAKKWRVFALDGAPDFEDSVTIVPLTADGKPERTVELYDVTVQDETRIPQIAEIYGKPLNELTWSELPAEQQDDMMRCIAGEKSRYLVSHPEGGMFALYSNLDPEGLRSEYNRRSKYGLLGKLWDNCPPFYRYTTWQMAAIDGGIYVAKTAYDLLKNEHDIPHCYDRRKPLFDQIRQFYHSGGGVYRSVRDGQRATLKLPTGKIAVEVIAEHVNSAYFYPEGSLLDILKIHNEVYAGGGHSKFGSVNNDFAFSKRDMRIPEEWGPNSVYGFGLASKGGRSFVESPVYKSPVDTYAGGFSSEVQWLSRRGVNRLDVDIFGGEIMGRGFRRAMIGLDILFQHYRRHGLILLGNEGRYGEILTGVTAQGIAESENLAYVVGYLDFYRGPKPVHNHIELKVGAGLLGIFRNGWNLGPEVMAKGFGSYIRWSPLKAIAGVHNFRAVSAGVNPVELFDIINRYRAERDVQEWPY